MPNYTPATAYSAVPKKKPVSALDRLYGAGLERAKPSTSIVEQTFGPMMSTKPQVSVGQPAPKTSQPSYGPQRFIGPVVPKQTPIKTVASTPVSSPTPSTSPTQPMDPGLAKLYQEKALTDAGRSKEAQMVGRESKANDISLIRPKASTTPGNSLLAALRPAAKQSVQQQAPAAPNPLDVLRGKVTSLMNPGEQERKLLEDLALFRGDSASSIAGLEGQGRGITAGLVRGQQEKEQRQDAIKEGTLMERLAAETAARKAALDAAQFDYGALNEQQQREQARQDALTAPMTVGGNILKYNPATGQYDTAYSAPAQAADPLTVSQGQTVIDPTTGQVIYNAPAKAEAQPATVQEYQYAQQNGYDGSFLDYQREKSAGGDGRGFSLSPGQVRYDNLGNQVAAAPSEQGKLAAGQQQDIVNIGSANTLIDEILGMANSSGNLPGIGVFGGRVPQIFTNENQQEVRAKLGALRASVVKANAGTSFTDGERALLEEYLPKPTDTDSMATTKLKVLQEMLNGKAQEIYQISGGGGGGSGYQGTGDPLDAALDGLGFKNASGQALSAPMGSLSEKYESGGNPGAIGYDSTGGYSYGTYQLAHNNAKSFVDQSPYKAQFQGLTFNSPQWRQKWQQIAQKDPQGFGAAQKGYIDKTHFQPQIQKLMSAGINVNSINPVVRDAIWSTAVQHGPGTDIVVNALKKAGSNPADQLKAIYALRWGNGQNFKSSTPQVKQSVYSRFFGKDGELNLALSKLNSMSSMG